MNRLIAILLVLTAAIIVQGKNSEMSDADTELLKSAVELVDAGMAESAMPDFDSLAKKYPDNFLVNYERLYALYALKKYEDVATVAKKMINKKDVQPVIFQLYGNVLDILGKPDEAIKVYTKGIKRFPDSGSLYLEIGNVYASQDKYNDALAFYNKGIDAEPRFGSNYYRAVPLYLASERGIVWGLIYAETEILLSPDKADRHKAMADDMKMILADKISVKKESDSTVVKVSLVPSRDIVLTDGAQSGFVDFPGVYEACTVGAVTRLAVSGSDITGSIASLAELRKGIVEAYFKSALNYFGNAMYLLPFQKSVIEAGHWETYNYYIFGPAFPDEFETWLNSNEDKFRAFVEWYNKAPFSLDRTHTVGINTIYRDAERLDILGTMLFQANLLKLEQ